eukprot:gene6737-10902_t
MGKKEFQDNKKKGRSSKYNENKQRRKLHSVSKTIKEYESCHSPTDWLKSFEKAVESSKKKEIRGSRIAILNQTFSAFIFEKYKIEDYSFVDLDKNKFLEAAFKTEYYKEKYEFKIPKLTNDEKKKTKILIIEGDCVDTGIYLKNEFKKNPTVLNMASDKNPGGGYRNGSGAQEENLHRRSNLFQCLEDPDDVNPDSVWDYPIPNFAGIYSPNVCFIRGNEASGYPFLEKPEYLSIVSVAAVRHPEVISKNKELMMNEKSAEITKEKIRRMFLISLENGHDSIVLSAFGCGAFGNPPKHVAMLFKEVIDEFDGYFDLIAFAIFNDHNSGKDHNKDGNVKPFADVFKQKPIKFETL